MIEEDDLMKDGDKLQYASTFINLKVRGGRNKVIDPLKEMISIDLDEDAPPL